MVENHEHSSDFTVRKKVDESWKDTAKKETAEDPSAGAEIPPIAPAFSVFASTLAMQALMALGALEDPSGEKEQENLPQAKYLIDILEMLGQKTKGNLTPEEDKMLQNILYELRVKFVEKGSAR